MTYAYLKEFLTNIDESEEVKLVHSKAYLKLVRFIEMLDACFAHP